MTPLFKKLNLKEQKNLLIVNKPDSFDAEINAMGVDYNFYYNSKELSDIEFCLVFVKSKDEIKLNIEELYPKLSNKTLIWFSYPKKSSKKYKCDFNRDNGWDIMGEHNLEPVRQVSIDENWSALRFRDVKEIKTMTRRKSMTLSEKGKAKTSGK